MRRFTEVPLPPDMPRKSTPAPTDLFMFLRTAMDSGLTMNAQNTAKHFDLRYLVVIIVPPVIMIVVYFVLQIRINRPRSVGELASNTIQIIMPERRRDGIYAMTFTGNRMHLRPR
jgi:hypothetical protein